jgi:alanine dehydrogenase
MPLLLDEDAVRALLPMEDLIPAMASALADFSAGRVTQPLRTVLEIGAARNFFGSMPAHVPAQHALGTKLVTVFGRNHERGLPSHLATILLLDEETGALQAIMDGRYITEARTAAVSALSVQQLARPDAATLAILGAGVQARSHLEAIALVRDLKDVRVWSRTASSAQRFVDEMTGHAPRAPLHAVGSAEAAVRGADIIVLVTAAVEPVLFDPWVRDGAHICAVGACRPTQREMDAGLVRRADLYVDSRQGALAEAGDIVLAIRDGAIDADHIQAELGEVVGQSAAGRGGPDRVTIFKSLGMAVEDVVAAHLAYSKARSAGLGKEI